MIVRALGARLTTVAGAVVCAVSGAAAPGAQQPIPRECPAVFEAQSALVQTWSPPSSAVHGFARFDRPALLVFPAEVSTVEVELWGGGGGGGGGSDETFSEGGAGGGGGASGAYVRGAVHLARANRYLLLVGEGGTGGSAGATGQPGRASVFCENGVALLYARGGPGGLGAPRNDKPGQGGRWQASDTPPTTADVLERVGHDGQRGAPPLLELRGLGGRGGTAVGGTIEGFGSRGGNGGAGAMRPDPAGPGIAGGSGLALVSW